MPVFNIHHITKYEYDRPVKESVNEIKIFPFADFSQETLHHDINITGQPDIYVVYDYWGNRSGMFNLMVPHRELVIESKLIVRALGKSTTAPPNDVNLASLIKETANNLSLLELSKITEIDLRERINETVREFYKPDLSVHTIIEKCGSFIFDQFSYVKGITTIETTVREILEHRSGVCQDFAHVMLEMLRSLGIPCRYVSGYICPNESGMRGEGATHAWIEAWMPGSGWVGNDPTNNIWVTNHHVKLAVGRNFSDCTPVKGTFKGPAWQSMSVYVSVGYEDGHTREEINKVKTEVLPGTGELPEYNENYAGQQQQ